MAETATTKIEAKLLGVWTNITADVLDGSISLRYGIDGDGPADCCASTGELRFAMRNDARNSGMTLGYYSPASASKRAGWGFGIAVRVSFTSGIYTDRVRFYGKVRVIAPVAGSSRGRTVEVVAYDVIRDLAETDAREVAIQTSKTESQLLTTLIAAVPAESQPLAQSFDSGVDSYPIAFDDLEGSAKALGVARDIAVSSVGMFYCSGDGTLRYRSRHSLATQTSLFTFANDMIELSVPSSLDKVYNRARATTHPKVVSATATDVLYTLPTGNPLLISPGDSLALWTDYTDPLDRQVKIGGTAVVTVLVAGTHYAANTASDGSGSSMNASLSATLTPFSSTAKWVLTNTSSSQALYVTALSIIGKAVRDPGPQTFESEAASITTDRPVEFDLPYQNDPYIGQSAADYTVAVYSELQSHINTLEFFANHSATFMSAALTLEPGDRVTVSETVTGLSSVECVVRSVEITVGSRSQLRCRIGLKPASTLAIWTLGTVTKSEIGSSTTLGF